MRVRTNNFAKDEKIIARSMDPEYTWIARNMGGKLLVFRNKPIRNISDFTWIPDGEAALVIPFQDMFKAIRWDDDEPTRIRDIYDPQIISEAGKEIIRAFRNNFEFDHAVFNSDRCYLLKSPEKNENFVIANFSVADESEVFLNVEYGKHYSIHELLKDENDAKQMNDYPSEAKEGPE